MGGSLYIRSKNGVLFTPPILNTINNFQGGNENISATTETVLSTLLIPANLLKNGDILEIHSRLNKVNNNGIVAVRIRIGTGQTTSDTLVGTYSSTTITHAFVPIRRVLKITNTTTEVASNVLSISYDNVMEGISFSDLTIDWSIDQYISITSQLDSSSDRIQCMYIKTKKFSTTW